MTTPNVQSGWYPDPSGQPGQRSRRLLGRVGVQQRELGPRPQPQAGQPRFGFARRGVVAGA